MSDVVLVAFKTYFDLIALLWYKNILHLTLRILFVVLLEKGNCRFSLPET